MKSFYSSILFALIGFLIANTAPVFGQAATEAKVKKIPFHGKLQSVDASANTITLAGKKEVRVFHLTPTTKITDGNGNPSSLSAAVAGEDVGGSYAKDSAGTMNLFSVRFGAKPGSKASSASPASTASTPMKAASTPAAATPEAATPAAAPASAKASAPDAAAPAPSAAKVKKQSFSGKVVSVDAAANTLVIHGKADQTFTVTSTTKITGVDGLSSLTAGTKVSGSYSKSADGATLTVYTLKVAK